MQLVESDGTASNTTIGGGSEYVTSGGAAVGVTFAGNSGTLDLEQPQGLTGTISNWQAGEFIDFVSTSITSASISGGSTLNVTVSGGSTYSYQLVGEEVGASVNLQSDGSSGTDVFLGLVVSSGSSLIVASGQTSIGIIVESGGLLEVLSGGTVITTTVSSGGTMELFGGAVANNTTINSGGTEEIGSGYTFSSTVSGGLTLEVASSGPSAVSPCRAGVSSSFSSRRRL